MKDSIHPDYRDVCFEDMTTGDRFIIRSTVITKDSIKIANKDGVEVTMPHAKLDTSAASHPFYTGLQKSVDSLGGRAERFRNRYGKTAGAATTTAS